MMLILPTFVQQLVVKIGILPDTKKPATLTVAGL